MFDSIKENLRKSAEERERAERVQRSETEAQERLRAERERKIATIRVITGEVKYRYAILDTLHVFALYRAEPGQAYDPTASTQQAKRQMQELAFVHHADAVIHAQYHLLRYSTTIRNYHDVPIYETHLFGTAIKIIGPPSDWVEGDE